MSLKQAATLAAQVPMCLNDMSEKRCTISYSVEFGCKYDKRLLSICRNQYAELVSTFKKLAKLGINSEVSMLTFYPLFACLAESEKGADMIVFDAGEEAAITKMVFVADKQAEALSVPEAPKQSTKTVKKKLAIAKPKPRRSSARTNGTCRYIDESNVEIPGRSTRDNAAVAVARNWLEYQQ